MNPEQQPQQEAFFDPEIADVRQFDQEIARLEKVQNIAKLSDPKEAGDIESYIEELKTMRDKKAEEGERAA